MNKYKFGKGMEIKRFFADAENFDGKYIVVDGEEFVHMSKVLRHKVGYQIIVNLDDGKDYNCTIRKLISVIGNRFF